MKVLGILVLLFNFSASANEVVKKVRMDWKDRDKFLVYHTLLCELGTRILTDQQGNQIKQEGLYCEASGDTTFFEQETISSKETVLKGPSTTGGYLRAKNLPLEKLKIKEEGSVVSICTDPKIWNAAEISYGDDSDYPQVCLTQI